MSNGISHRSRLLMILSGLVLALLSMQAQAVPSFARQTGLACSACHTVAPQLTAFGRYFKLHGYVLGPSKLSGGSQQLSIDKFPPLSAMLMISDTVTSKAQPGTQNGSVAFPDQLSIFYAGAIAEHMGAFAQITYEEPADHFSIDNTDIRYARDITWGDQTMVWGLTLNNNPTVEDVWNSTPAWGYPYVASGVAPAPTAAPLLDGALGQAVAGLGAYAWLNSTWYGVFSVYRSSQAGVNQPYDSTTSEVISGLAPYWRLAWDHPWASGNGQNDLEIGTFGLNAHIYPGNGNPLSGPTDNYQDIGVDSQYQFLTGADSLALHAAYIHERQNLNASVAGGLAANPSNHLDSWDINASYYWDEAYGPTIGYFNTTGSSDNILYAPGPVSGSATGSPNSNGWILQWTWLPALNVQATAQYVIYNKFNGASNNYDGSGRNASDNNTLYLNLWLLW